MSAGTGSSGTGGGVCFCSLAHSHDWNERVKEVEEVAATGHEHHHHHLHPTRTIQQELDLLQKQSIQLIDSMRVAAIYQYQSVMKQSTSIEPGEYEAMEVEEAEESKSSCYANSLHRPDHDLSDSDPLIIPPTDRPPILPLAQLHQFFQSCIDLHRQLSLFTFYPGLWSETDFNQNPTVIALRPVCPPPQLVLQLHTRFILQFIPLLPTICAMLCTPPPITGPSHSRPASAAAPSSDSSAYQFDLLCYHQPLFDAVLTLIEQFYLDFNWQDSKLDLKLATSAEARTLNTTLKLPQKSHEILSVVGKWLVGLDHKLAHLLHRNPINSNGSLPNGPTYRPLLDYAKKIGQVLRHGAVFGGHASDRQLHPLMCQSLLQQFHSIENDELKKVTDDHAKSISDSSQSSTRIKFILPDSFFSSICHLFYEEVKYLPRDSVLAGGLRPFDPSQSQPAAFSKPMLDLLDVVISHVLIHYETYSARFQRWTCQQLQSIRTQFDSSTTDPTESYSFYFGLDYFLHFVRLHHAHILPYLPTPSTKYLFYHHFPIVFEDEFLKLISRLTHDLKSMDLARRAEVIDTKLREWFGMRTTGLTPSSISTPTPPTPTKATLSTTLPSTTPSPRPDSTGPRQSSGGSPISASPITSLFSPFFTYGLMESKSIKPESTSKTFTIHLQHTTDWQHQAPIELFHQANQIIQRLCLDTPGNTLCMDVLYWINSVLLNRLRTEKPNEPYAWKQLCPTCVHPIAEQLISISTSTAAPPHSIDFIRAIWFPIYKLMKSSSSVSSSNEGELQAIWLLLGQFRHWVDYAYFIYTQELSSGNHLQPIASLIAFTLSPLDHDSFQLIRDRLIRARQHMPKLPPSIKNMPQSELASFEVKLNSFLDELVQDVSPTIRVHLYAHLLPIVQPESVLLSRLLNSTHPTTLPGASLSFITHTIHRWICGALMARICLPTLTDSNNSTQSANPVRVSFHPSVSLAKLVGRLKQQLSLNTYKDLYHQLNHIYGIERQQLEPNTPNRA